MNPRSLLVALALGLARTASAAAPPPTGFRFVHKDWEVACDNTGTCRAAGYHEEYSESRVSVLVTRRPGPGTRPEVRLVLGGYEVIPGLKPLPPRPVVTMHVNDRPLGAVRLDDALSGTLSPAQATALLAALPRAGARITWNHTHYEWVLSDQGARAVLLRMDEAQGRLNTPGALVARGTRDERQVPGPRPAPVIRVPPVPPTLDADRAWPERQGPALLAALRATAAKGDMCSLLMEDRGDREWEVRRLNARQLLVSTPCWSAAYNFGVGAWVVNEHPPYAPVLITDSASGINDTEVVASQKDRGLGDCWDHQAWAWDGTRFERSESFSTGMCRAIQPGGAWNLPTLVTRVQPR